MLCAHPVAQLWKPGRCLNSFPGVTDSLASMRSAAALGVSDAPPTPLASAPDAINDVHSKPGSEQAIARSSSGEPATPGHASSRSAWECGYGASAGAGHGK